MDTVLHMVALDYKWLHCVTHVYIELHMVTLGYKWLQWVTFGYTGLH